MYVCVWVCVWVCVCVCMGMCMCVEGEEGEEEEKGWEEGQLL